MPIDSNHPMYDKFLPRWRKARAFISGEDEVKEAGELYLPKLAHMNVKDDPIGEEYASYLRGAGLYESPGRTCQGLVGLINRKQPNWDGIPKKMEPWLEDITLSGCSLTDFARLASLEAMTPGRVGIYLGYDSDQRRPYLEIFMAEHIRNWREVRYLGAIMPKFIVLEAEQVDEESDQYDPKTREGRQEIRLNEETGGYEQIIHIKTDNGWQEGEAVPYTIHQSKQFTKCPFVVINPIRNGLHVETPPLMGLVHESGRHYVESAMFARSRHKMGPWYYALGVDMKDDEALIVGGNSAFTCSSSDAKVGVVGYDGAGLDLHIKVMEAQEKRMAILGARLLETQKREAETAEAKRIGALGDSATLSTITESLSQGIEQALKLMAELEGLSSEAITFSANKDFIDQQIQPDQALKIVEAWQKGGITKADMFFNLQRGEMLDPSWNYESWNQAIEEESAAVAIQTESDLANFAKK